MTTDAKADFTDFESFASRYLPLGLLVANDLGKVAAEAIMVGPKVGELIYEIGDQLQGLYVIRSGVVDIISPEGETLMHLATGDSFGERGLLQDGLAPNRAVAADDCQLILVPASTFKHLLDTAAAFAAFFERPPPMSMDDASGGLASTPIADLMASEPVTIGPEQPVKEAASIMRDRDISCLPVVSNGVLVGLLTSGDLVDRVLALGLDGDVPVKEAMTPDPFTLGPDELGFDALLAMTERSIGHLPIVENGSLVGILTSSNLIRRQAMSSIFLIGDIKKGETIDALKKAVDQVPRLLVQLVASGVAAHDIGRIITGVADALTGRLLEMAEISLGPPPVPYLWLACGSQGREEQTGVSDQDNCLFLDDGYRPKDHGGYFEQLAKIVSDGLDACGYYYCPGDMMATNPRWRQPTSVWRQYFRGWIAEPDPMAQMLSSVMFDLRPIAGEMSLFDGMQSATLARAKKNSIFRAHMISNSLKHMPPLSLFRGFTLIRRGEHKDTLDLKLNGVVPIVDLARVYALDAAIDKVNTRERLLLAREAGAISESGFRDLIDAYDLIAMTRLRHQAGQIRKGEKPDNFVSPSVLSDLERSHLKDAFLIIKTLQSALGHRAGIR